VQSSQLELTTEILPPSKDSTLQHILLLSLRNRGVQGDIDNLKIVLHRNDGDAPLDLEIPLKLLKPGQIWSKRFSLPDPKTKQLSVEVEFKYDNHQHRMSKAILTADQLKDKSTEKSVLESNLGAVTTLFGSLLGILGTLAATWMAQSPQRTERVGRRRRAIIEFQRKLASDVKVTTLQDAYQALVNELTPLAVPKAIRKAYNKLELHSLQAGDNVPALRISQFEGLRKVVRLETER